MAKRTTKPAKRDQPIIERAKAAKPARRRAKAAPRVPVPTDEEIRERAYYLSLERNGSPGDPVDDWNRAKEQLESAALPAPRRTPARRAPR